VIVRLGILTCAFRCSIVAQGDEYRSSSTNDRRSEGGRRAASGTRRCSFPTETPSARKENRMSNRSW